LLCIYSVSLDCPFLIVASIFPGVNVMTVCYYWLLLNFNYLSETSWSWSYDIWIYSYLCNQSISPLKLCVRIPLMARCTRYNIMGGVFSPCTPASSNN
jgi:hypothetical protein